MVAAYIPLASASQEECPLVQAYPGKVPFRLGKIPTGPRPKGKGGMPSHLALPVER